MTTHEIAAMLDDLVGSQVEKVTQQAKAMKKLAEQKYSDAKAIMQEAEKKTADFKKAVSKETVKLNDRISEMSIQSKKDKDTITRLREKLANLVSQNEKLTAKLEAVPAPVKAMVAK